VTKAFVIHNVGRVERDPHDPTHNNAVWTFCEDLPTVDKLKVHESAPVLFRTGRGAETNVVIRVPLYGENTWACKECDDEFLKTDINGVQAHLHLHSRQAEGEQ
jgi:hypothetical protein